MARNRPWPDFVNNPPETTNTPTESSTKEEVHIPTVGEELEKILGKSAKTPTSWCRKVATKVVDGHQVDFYELEAGRLPVFKKDPRSVSYVVSRRTKEAEAITEGEAVLCPLSKPTDMRGGITEEQGIKALLAKCGSDWKVNVIRVSDFDQLTFLAQPHDFSPDSGINK